MTVRGPRPLARRTRAGFTLLEMMAVVLMTSIVLGAAVDSYLDISRASNAAVHATLEARRATSLLDRMAREFQGAVLLVKPEELDPLSHPWVFLAEADNESDGAQRVKFVTRSHRPAASAVHESDLAVVSFVTRETEEGDLALLRSVQKRLPEKLDTSFPRDEDDGAQLLAEGLARLGMRFLTEEGGWTASFDSSTLVHSGQLPRAVEIELAYLVENDQGDWEEGASYTRQVLLPMRPLNLEEIEEEQETAELEDEDCILISQCLGSNPELLSQLGPAILEQLAEVGEECAADHSGLFASAGGLPKDCR